MPRLVLCTSSIKFLLMLDSEEGVREGGIRRETSEKGTKGLQPCNKNLCELWLRGGVGGQFLRIFYRFQRSFLACGVFARRPKS